MAKLSRLLLALCVIIAIALLWWHTDSSQQVNPAIELVSNRINAESKPLQATRSVPTPVLIERVDSIDAPSNATVEGVSVQGVVQDQLGQSIGGMRVEFSPKASSSWGKKLYTATTDDKGEFLLNDIPAGIEYRLEVLGSGIYLSNLLNSVTVDLDMPTLTVTLDSVELVSVDGMFIGTDNTPIADFEILVQNIGIAYPGRKIIGDSSGFFQLAQFPAGELHLSTRGEEDFKITGITLRAGEYRNLILTLDKGGYHLAGRVIGELNAPVTQARVALTSSFMRDGYRSSSYRFTVTDSNGGFTFAGLSNNDHQLSVDAIGYQTRKFNHHFESFSEDLEIQIQAE